MLWWLINAFAAGQSSSIKLSVKTLAKISATTLLNQAYVLHQTGQVDKKTLSNTVETSKCWAKPV